MLNIRKLIIAAAAAGSLVAVNTSANAGGFIGDIIEHACGDCGVGRALDDANDALGHPAEQAGEAVMDYYVPGSGEVYHQIWTDQYGQRHYR